MQVRRIIFLLALFSFISSITGGYLYFSSQRRTAIDYAHADAEKALKSLADIMTWHYHSRQNEIKAIAGLKEIRQALITDTPQALAKANATLKHFQNALKADACYLMNATGNTIASSNHDFPVSFVGKNYSFRPYFQQAIKGELGFYFALGITSKKRGAYISYPVYINNQDTPSGVIVLKVSADHMEKWLKKLEEGYVVLIDPDGVIFASNNKNWLFHLLWQGSPEIINQIANSRQFGIGPWIWTGIEKVDMRHAVDQSGNKYRLHPVKLSFSQGWQLLYLHDLKKVSSKAHDELFRIASYIIMALCALIGIFAFFLYRKAHRDLAERQKMEEKLRKISITDELTDTLNRRGFFILATQQLKIDNRSHGGIFLLYADLDNMKWINDNIGHHEGDEALKNAANLLKTTFRESDIIGRLGGDEFAVLLTSVDGKDNKQTIIARLEKNLKKFNEQNPKTYELQISVGIVRYNFDVPCSIDELLSQADTLMYKNKMQRKQKTTM